jgi:hypothetical protein
MKRAISGDRGQVMLKKDDMKLRKKIIRLALKHSLNCSSLLPFAFLII